MSEYVRRVRQTDRAFALRLEQLDIELTERCNNDCIHCCINLPANDAEAQRRELTTQQIRDIFGQAAELGCLQVRITGGEPLLRDDFAELYLVARRLGLRVQLYTNACLVTPAIADLFARIPPLAPVEVTVYGMCRESYEAVTRAPGSFRRFREGASLLEERGVPFWVKTALLPQNRADMDGFEAWAKTLPSMTRPPLYSLFFDLRERRDDEKKNRLIQSLRLSPKEGVSFLMKNDKSREELSRFAAKFFRPFSDRLFDCGVCEGGNLCVDAYGRAQPCMGVRTPALTIDLLGGAGKTTLRDAQERFAPLRDMLAANPDYLRRCARCFLRGLCEQCPAKSWAEHGTLDTPVDYLCEVAHAMARAMGWLTGDEHGWEARNWHERVGQTPIDRQKRRVL